MIVHEVAGAGGAGNTPARPAASSTPAPAPIVPTPIAAPEVLTRTTRLDNGRLPRRGAAAARG